MNMPKAHASEAQSAGELDQTFAPSGIQQLQFRDMSKTIGESVAVLPTGRILVSATVIDAAGASHYGLAQLLPDGDLDKDFGMDGYLHGQFVEGRSSHGGILVVEASGAFWMSAVLAESSGKLQQIIARFKADGTLDTKFGAEGSGYRVVPMRIPALSNATGGHLTLAQSDPAKSTADRLLFSTSKGGSGLLARFFLNGVDDGDFAEHGWIPLTMPDLSITLHGVAQSSDGRIFVYGKTEVTNQGLVMAFDNAGAVVTSFGQNGILLLNLRHAGASLESTVNHIIVQSAQRLLLIGSAVESSAGEKRQHAFISGILNNGTFDPDFNAGVPVITAATEALYLRSWRAGFALDDNDGKRIVTVGQTSAGERRLLTGGFLVDGAVDPAFDVQGTARIEWTAQAACLQNSRVLVLGHKDGAAYVVRLLTAAVG